MDWHDEDLFGITIPAHAAEVALSLSQDTVEPTDMPERAELPVIDLTVAEIPSRKGFIHRLLGR